MSGDLQTDFTRQPVCPHCGYECRDAWEIDFGAGLDGDAEIQCGRCEAIYFASRIVDVCYTTSPLKVKA